MRWIVNKTVVGPNYDKLTNLVRAVVSPDLLEPCRASARQLAVSAQYTPIIKAVLACYATEFPPGEACLKAADQAIQEEQDRLENIYAVACALRQIRGLVLKLPKRYVSQLRRTTSVPHDLRAYY
jgi:hypothetical protein